MFSPYHRLSNCQSLQQLVLKLHEDGNMTDEAFKDHKKYHYSLMHKLKSAKRHLENLQDVLENTEASSVVDNSTEFINEVNMHLDSFFYCSGSALDILARELLGYFNIPLPNRVYFSTAKTQITAARAGDPILPRLQTPSWDQEFRDYRNALTHEVLIGTNFSISVNADGGRSHTTIVYPLPDDPRVTIESRTFNSNPNAFIYCETTFKRILRLLNTIYGEIVQRATTSNRLPL